MKSARTPADRGDHPPRIPTSPSLNSRPWPECPEAPCLSGRSSFQKKRFDGATGLTKSRPRGPFTEAGRWRPGSRKKALPWGGNGFRRRCGRGDLKGFTPAPISADGTSNTGSIPISSGTSFPNIHIMWGGSISRRSTFYGEGCAGLAIIDGFSRSVLSWELDHTLEMPFVRDCVDRALATAVPTIGNSAPGSPFTTPPLSRSLIARNLKIRRDDLPLE